MANKGIRTLFCDLGGVLLTNGWDHKSRQKAAELFGFELPEVESRHQLVFGDYECGKLTLDEYLHYAIFFQPRSFSLDAFKEFMLAQSQPFSEMIAWVKQLKEKNNLRVVIVSNEGRELTQHRIKSFNLAELGDFFFVSCFLGIRKPDRQVFRMALDVVQVPPEQILYLDDRQLFVEIAQEMGIKAIRHTDLLTTQKAVSQYFDKV